MTAVPPLADAAEVERLRARLRALERLSEVAVGMAAALEVADTLHSVTAGVVDALGFGVAVLNLVTPDGVEVVSVAGPAEVRDTLFGSRHPLDGWNQLLDKSTPLGQLRFVDGRDGDDTDDLFSWVPDLPVSDDPTMWHPMDALFAPLHDPDGALIGILSVDLPPGGRRPDAATVEMLEKYAVQAALALTRARLHDAVASSAELFARTFADAPIGMALVDATGRFLEVNAAGAATFGRPAAILVGMSPGDVTAGEDRGRLQRAVAETLAGGPDRCNLEIRTAPGGRYAEVVLTRLTASGRPRVLMQLADVTETRAMERVLREQATTDPLTGLVNRSGLLDRLDDALAADPASVALLFCDVDHFKLINDSHGHGCGDELLVEVAAALRGALRDDDVAARMGGDEFVILLRSVHGPADAIAVADRISQQVRRPIVVQLTSVTPSLSIGIALGTPALSASELLARADAALYRAKSGGRDRWELFTDDLAAEATGQLNLRQELVRAVHRCEFRLHYQPIVDLATGVAVGHEALLRWQHPDGQLRSPAAFLPLLMSTELATPASDWVVAQAVRDAAAADGDHFVSVNMSPAQLNRSDLVASVAAALDEHGLAPSRLWVEVTEEAAVSGAAATRTLAGLQALGVRTVLDDFGSGYAGLLALRDLPVEVIKLDRAFTAPMGTDDVSPQLIAAMVALCHNLGRTVVAEGIETADQLAGLRSLGVELGQGWHLGRPAPRAGDHSVVPVPRRSRIADLDTELRRTAAALGAATTIEHLGHLAVQAAQRICSVEGGSLALLTGDGRLRTVFIVGYPEDVVARFALFDVTSAVPVAQAVRSGVDVWLDPAAMAVSSDALIRRGSRTRGAIAGLPLVMDGRCLGGLSLTWCANERVDDVVRDYMRELARLVAGQLAELTAASGAA